MTTKIDSMKDLQHEKKMLRYEIDATERLLAQALYSGKSRLLNSVASAFLPAKKSPQAQLLNVVSTPGKRNKWFKLAIQFLPFLLRLYGRLKRNTA